MVLPRFLCESEITKANYETIQTVFYTKWLLHCIKLQSDWIPFRNFDFKSEKCKKFSNLRKITKLIIMKGYGALVLSIPDGRSKPLFAPYDFKPSPGVPKFLPRPKNIFGHLVGWFEIICIIHMAQIAVRTFYSALKAQLVHNL